MSAAIALLRRELQLAWRQGNSSGMAIAFFLIVVTLFPLGIGPELDLLARIAAGVIWVAMLLSALLSLDRMFHADFEDGTLDALILSPLANEVVVLVKCAGHFAATLVPLILASPLMAVLLNLAPDAIPRLMLALIVGGPALSLIGAIGAALTVSLKRGGVIVSLLVLPLYIPTLIFGVAAIEPGPAGNTALLFLGAITLFALALSPIASAAALKLSLD